MNWHERIDDYLDGKLSDAEREAFELQLKTDGKLSEALALHADARTLLKLAARDALKSKIAAIDRHQSQQPRFSVMTMAAALVILLGAVIAWAVLSQPAEPSYAEYFEPYPDRITVMGDSETSLNHAMRAYNQYDYQAALKAFNAADTSQAEQYALYRAVCYIALDSCENALHELRPLTESLSSFHEAARWYEILAELQCGQNSRAHTLLQQYLQDEGRKFNRTKAQELLARLEQ